MWPNHIGWFINFIYRHTHHVFYKKKKKKLLKTNLGLIRSLSLYIKHASKPIPSHPGKQFRGILYAGWNLQVSWRWTQSKTEPLKRICFCLHAEGSSWRDQIRSEPARVKNSRSFLVIQSPLCPLKKTKIIFSIVCHPSFFAHKW